MVHNPGQLLMVKVHPPRTTSVFLNHKVPRTHIKPAAADFLLLLQRSWSLENSYGIFAVQSTSQNIIISIKQLLWSPIIIQVALWSFRLKMSPRELGAKVGISDYKGKSCTHAALMCLSSFAECSHLHGIRVCSARQGRMCRHNREPDLSLQNTQHPLLIELLDGPNPGSLLHLLNYANFTYLRVF